MSNKQQTSSSTNNHLYVKFLYFHLILKAHFSVFSIFHSVAMAQKVKTSRLNSEQPQIKLVALNRHIEQLHLALSSIEGDAKDLQDAILINKNIALILLQSPTTNPLAHRALTLMHSNSQTLSQIRLQRSQRQQLVTRTFLQNQVNAQQQLFFRERLTMHAEHIDDMRKLMHDKEYGYSNLVEELNRFEELPENEVEISVANVDYILAENNSRRVLARLSREKEGLVRGGRENQRERVGITAQWRNVVEGIQKGLEYQKIVTMFDENDEMRSEGDEHLTESRKCIENKREQQLSETSPPSLANIHKELITIFKRQTKANRIMAEQFRQSVEIGEQVKSQNQRLLQNSLNLSIQSNRYYQHLKTVQAMLLSHSNRIINDIQQQIDLSELKKQQGSSTMISNPIFRDNINKYNKQSFSETFLIKCGSEPDYTRSEKNLSKLQL